MSARVQAIRLRRREKRKLARMAKRPRLDVKKKCERCHGMGKPPYGCRSCGRKRPVKLVRLVCYREYHPHIWSGGYKAGNYSKHVLRVSNGC